MSQPAASDRRFILLTGSEPWTKQAAGTITRNIPEKSRLDMLAQGGAAHKGNIQAIIGREHELVVYDMFAGFDPDLFAASVETLIAGGSLLLLAPEMNQWRQFVDPWSARITQWPHTVESVEQRFLNRFGRLIHQSSLPQIVTEGDRLPELVRPGPRKTATTRGQKMLIQQLQQWLGDGLNLPVVIQADRGRGKSAVLGILAHYLIKKKHEVIVTAPGKSSLQTLFKHAGDSADALAFFSVDRLLAERPETGFLLVDEASAFPLPVLKALLAHYPQAIMATTVHGYEGSGRGFALRFHDYLDRVWSGWQLFSLKEPLRYRQDDPLEAFLYRSLLFNTTLPMVGPATSAFSLSDCCFREIHQHELLEDEHLLGEVFGLLVMAHYQTRPTDLRHLLDGVAVRIYGGFCQGALVATAMTVQEGGFDTELAREIWLGRRRPGGNLAPQSLANHSGIPEAAERVTERIMRIVVHPQYQRRGVGSALLKHILKQDNGVDYRSSAFGAADSRLLQFWKKNGFRLVRLGLRKDKSSGVRSAIVIKAQSDAIAMLMERLRRQFARQFRYLQNSHYADVAGEFLQALELLPPENSPLLDADEVQDIDSWREGHRPFEFCGHALEKWLALLPGGWQALLDCEEYQLIRMKVIEQASWSEVCSALDIQGKKKAQQRLRLAIRKLPAPGEQDRRLPGTG